LAVTYSNISNSYRMLGRAQFRLLDVYESTLHFSTVTFSRYLNCALL